MFSVVRPKEIPSCLSRGQYNDKEVVDILMPIFHGKCYLCEQDELSDPEIEHFSPHLKDDNKKFDWNNLFLSCSRCNSIKSSTHIDLLNCCDETLNVFRAIKCLMPSVPDGSVTVESTTANCIKSSNTVALLKECYNSTNTPLRGITRSVLMEKLFAHYTDFLIHRRTLKDKRSSDFELEQAKGRLKSMFKISFPFSVFWRWHLINDTYLSEQFKDEIDF